MKLIFMANWVICIRPSSGCVGVQTGVLNAWSETSGGHPSKTTALQLAPGYRQPVIDRTMLFEYRLRGQELYWLGDLWSVAFDSSALQPVCTPPSSPTPPLPPPPFPPCHPPSPLVLLRPPLFGRGIWEGTFRSEPSEEGSANHS